MCGIWASIGFVPPAAVMDCVAHRGPDGHGLRQWASPAGPVVFGHRRLAIFDLDQRSNQPLTDDEGRVSIVFNGAIYNFRDIRDQLERLGRRFATTSDTEVLLAAYSVWGEQCLERLNGMFAFAIFDSAEQRLFIARDRFGIKPLYWWSDGERLAFASEVKQLLAIPGVAARANPNALHDFLMFGVTDHGPATCFAGIAPVPPGHLATLDLSRHTNGFSRPLGLRRWYRLPAAQDPGASPQDAARELASCLEHSIALRLSADVPVGSCLSGGIDSSAIVGVIAAGGRTAGQHCVSAVYPGQSVDEGRYVDAVAERWPSLMVHRVEPKPDGLAAGLRRLVWHQDEPFGSTSIYAQWCVFETAKSAGLKVMLDGQGADELFGGYRPMHGAHLADLLRTGSVRAAVTSAWQLKRESGYTILRQSLWAAAALAPDGVSARARTMIGDEPMGRWVRSAAGTFQVPLNPGSGKGRGMDGLSRRLVTATSLPMLLRYEDRNSMAHSVEARVPFLDYRLVEAAMRLGGRYNIRDGQSKWVERRAIASYLPAAVQARRDKVGFATPEAGWLSGPLASQARAGIDTAIECLGNLVDGDRVRREAGQMIAGERPYDRSLWRLWCTGVWAEVFAVTIG